MKADLSPGDPRWRRLLGAAALALSGAAVVWTVASAAVLGTTFDEPHHLATGLEWWQFGTYRWWTENPPLPKVLTALGPYLAGARLPAPPHAPGMDSPWDAGITALDQGGARILMLARLGTLPFLLLALGLTYVLGGGRRRPLPALVATSLVATYPPLLGHAGLATTDVAAVASVLAFLLTLDRWTAAPTRRRAALVGAALALATLCKLTAPPVCAVVGLAWLGAARWARGTWFAAPAPPRPRELAAQVGLAAAAAFLVAWAGYRFSVGRLDDFPPMAYLGTPVLPPTGQRSAFLAWLARVPLPAPELLHGLLFLRAHDTHGHLAFLFGETREHGFRTFYLVGLLLKSPLPFLVLVAGAVPQALRARGRAGLGPRGLGAGLAAVAALAFSTVVGVNIGVRHFLIVVPLLAIFAAAAAASWIEILGQRRRVAVGAALALLLVGQAAVTERARPELMAYFNPLAGREPGHALIDSDLDWGQDVRLLGRELRARGISSVHYGLFAIVNPCDPELPGLVPLEPRRPVTGWVVLSEQFFRAGLKFSFRRESCAPGAHYPFHIDPADAYDWLKAYQPVAWVGASLRLYHIPEEAR
jgi:hypothetical protein